MKYTTTLAATLALLLPLASAYIDHKGSSYCSSYKKQYGNLGGDFVKTIGEYGDDTEYGNHQFVCKKVVGPPGAICAFTQNMPGNQQLKMKDVKALAKKLVDSGVQRCGSISINELDSLKGKDGLLTFNYVSDPCGLGLNPSYYEKCDRY